VVWLVHITLQNFCVCRVPLDCVLLPTISNLLVFIAHPSSMVLPVAKLSVGEIAEAHNVRPYDIYIRFKKEICSVSFTFHNLFAALKYDKVLGVVCTVNVNCEVEVHSSVQGSLKTVEN